MPSIKIRPSILSADFGNLRKAIAEVEGCADGLHCDVMDGHFVPNITFGPMIIKAVRELTTMPLYAHLMIEAPDQYIQAFAEAGACEITVHAEACVHLHRTIGHIKDHGAAAGVALNPATPVCALENIITDIDAVLVMTVEPGFGGQQFIEAMLPKTTAVRNLAERSGGEIDVAVDGGIAPQTAQQVVAAGASVLVAGSDIYAGKTSPLHACKLLRDAVTSAIDSPGGKRQ